MSQEFVRNARQEIVYIRENIAGITRILNPKGVCIGMIKDGRTLDARGTTLSYSVNEAAIISHAGLKF